MLKLQIQFQHECSMHFPTARQIKFKTSRTKCINSLIFLEIFENETLSETRIAMTNMKMS